MSKGNCNVVSKGKTLLRLLLKIVLIFFQNCNFYILDAAVIPS